MRAGDSVNYSIGQGDTLVTPIQMATIYSAITNGGTLYNPTVGKAVISPDGKTRRGDQAQVARQAADRRKTTQAEIDDALAGVATRGTAAWRFGGWPQDKIPMHAKTGTAEVYGKQTTSWFATYTKDYTIVMTISQGGTGSGASGPAVRKHLQRACTGLDEDGKIRTRRRPCCPPRRRACRRSSPTAPSTPRRSAVRPPSPEELAPPALARPARRSARARHD